ncbi:hypothetical protein HDK90DRAFT_485137, partial [Phyllosticta capitalensis]
FPSLPFPSLTSPFLSLSLSLGPGKSSCVRFSCNLHFLLLPLLSAFIDGYPMVWKWDGARVRAWQPRETAWVYDDWNDGCGCGCGCDAMMPQLGSYAMRSCMLLCDSLRFDAMRCCCAAFALMLA